MLSRAVWMNRFSLLDEYLTSLRSQHWELSLSLGLESFPLGRNETKTEYTSSSGVARAIPNLTLAIAMAMPTSSRHITTVSIFVLFAFLLCGSSVCGEEEAPSRSVSRHKPYLLQQGFFHLLPFNCCFFAHFIQDH